MGSVGDRRILAVDWDQRELRVVHARIRKDKVRVQDVFAVSIPDEVSVSDAEAMGRLLRRALNQEQISCRRVIVDIPRDQAVLSTLSLPSVSVSDLAGMVKLQVGKSLSFAVSEAVIDFALPHEERDESEEPRDVLAAAVQSEVVDFYRQVCRNRTLADPPFTRQHEKLVPDVLHPVLKCLLFPLSLCLIHRRWLLTRLLCHAHSVSSLSNPALLRPQERRRCVCLVQPPVMTGSPRVENPADLSHPRPQPKAA